ncbi:MAG: type I restriction enzyme HsdR N-terminal domain-containing protein, partial [Desulfovibrio sp.]|nr:type I restriction enzyme HsdR N-terminal domain-containing protein [Desulfovibrio sp.]
MWIDKILKNTGHNDSLFSDEERAAVESSITVKSVKGKETPYITCQVRNKEIKLTPEEAVRQLYIHRLLHEYGYHVNRLQAEFPVNFGREIKKADIVIFDRKRLTDAYIIVELKKPKLADGKDQLKSYC